MTQFDENKIRNFIRAVENWPVPGVTYRDITPLLSSPVTMKMVTASLCRLFDGEPVTHIGMLDARGFIFGSQVAAMLSLPVVPFRKAGKLPYNCIREEYTLEYGTATIEVHSDALSEGDHILLVDDLIATGGTLLAAATLARRLNAKVTGAIAVIDLPELGGSKKLREEGVVTKCLTAY